MPVRPAGAGPEDAATRAATALDALRGLLDADGGALASVGPVAPSSADEPVAWPVTRAAITAWFGHRSLEAAVLVDGLAGLVAARTGEGMPVDAADAWVRGEVAAGRAPSIFARLAGHDGEPLDRGVDDRVSLSFTAWLLPQYGEAAVRRFLGEFDPERRDAAAEAAFSSPLGSLEERWIASLGRRRSLRSTVTSMLPILAPLFRPFAVRIVELFGWMVAGAILTVAVPYAVKILIDDVLPSRSGPLLAVFAVGLLALNVGDNLVSVRRSYVASLIDTKIRIGLQGRLFERLERLPHAFYARSDSGDLIARMTDDLGQVTGAVSGVVTRGVSSAVNAVVAAVVLLALNALLGVLVLLVVPAFAALFVVMRTRFELVSLAYQRAQGDAVSAMQEQLMAHAVVKAFGLAERLADAFGARLAAVFRTYMRLTLLGSVFEASLGFGISFASVLVMGVGGWLVIDGSLTVGGLLAFLGVMPSLFAPVAALAGAGQMVQRASGSLERVMEILDAPLTIDDRPGAIALPHPATAITFEGVTFGYEPDRPILRDLDLTVPVGSSVAIVGASGSGKSTLVNLLLRFYDPDAGRVCVDGLDLRDATLATLRGSIGIVFQDTFVFDTTIRENIAVGRLGATDGEITAAVRAAQLEGYVLAQPAGLDTVLGERGLRMSGGQRQRLAIARALLRDPAILILDEATSALDATTEAEVQAVLATAARGRTTIAITHRLTSVASADRIVVMADGRIVESGAFEELVRAGGPFQALYDEQMAVAAEGAARARAATEDGGEGSAAESAA